MRVQLHLVVLMAVVEPRLDLELELHRPATRRHAAAAGGGHVRLVLDRHEVLHLDDASGVKKR